MERTFAEPFQLYHRPLFQQVTVEMSQTTTANHFAIPDTWWKDGYFFGRRYYEPDNSIDGYIPGKRESLAQRTAREVKGIVDLLGLARGARILDLPCGYGRHSNALADRGYQVTGLDLDAEHLAKARESAQARFREGDMREIDADLHGRFDAVINMFYSFGFFQSEAENRQTMEQFYRALGDGGRLLMHSDVSVEMIENGTTQTDAIRALPDGNRLVILERFNPLTRRMEGSWETTDGIGRVIYPRAFYSVRIYTGTELADMAREIGFSDIALFGSFAGEPFGTASSELILVARKAAAPTGARQWLRRSAPPQVSTE